MLFVGLNPITDQLKNVKVRQAMSYAMNYDVHVKEIIQGKGRAISGPLASSAGSTSTKRNSWSLASSWARDHANSAAVQRSAE